MIATKLCSLLLCATCFAGCTTVSNSCNGNSGKADVNTSVSEDAATMFSDADKEVGYDETNATIVTLRDNATNSLGGGAAVFGNTITISAAGTYVLQGTLSNGQIVVNAAKTDQVRLILNNVSVTHSSSAPLYIKQADKVRITLVEQSQNMLATTGAFVAIDDNSIDAVLYSKDDVTINGTGNLSISNAYGNGITSKDDLILTGGAYTFHVSGHALEGNDSVRIARGTFEITSGKDGIHSDNTEDDTLGFIYVSGGKFTITSEADGMDATSLIQIDGGEFAITSIDDSVHSNNNVIIHDGSLAISSGDDGIHADANLNIQNGTINITKSYEGMEGHSIDVNGGTIHIIASDDGLNAASGTDGTDTSDNAEKDPFATDENAYIKITGGVFRVNASGDGMDSNGNLSVTGGETYVSGPTNNGNGAVDYNGTATISGGVFLAAGASGMAQNFGSSSTQGSILATMQTMQSGAVVLKDSNGSELFRYTPEKQYNSVVASVPGLKKGENYSLSMGTNTQTIELSSLVYGTGGSMGGGGGAPGFNSGQNPGKNGSRPSKSGNGPMGVPRADGSAPLANAG